MDNEPHGNSKKSQKPQHVYKIVDTEFNDIAKFGISGQELNLNGTSPRANTQVNALNKLWGWIKYQAIILQTAIKGRGKALDIESDYVKEYKRTHGGNSPTEQKRPNPEIE